MSARSIAHHDDDALPDVQGRVALVTAFWDQVRADLALWYLELDAHLDRAHRDLTGALDGKAGARLLTKAQNRVYRFEARRKAVVDTVRWIEHAPGFLAWCGIGGVAPDAVRDHLRERYPGPFALFDTQSGRGSVSWPPTPGDDRPGEAGGGRGRSAAAARHVRRVR
jgi:hypothetical protein